MTYTSSLPYPSPRSLPCHSAAQGARRAWRASVMKGVTAWRLLLLSLSAARTTNVISAGVAPAASPGAEAQSRLTTHAVKNSWQAALEGLLAQPNNTQVVVVGASDMSYAAGFAHWFAMTRREGTLPVLVALDSATCTQAGAGYGPHVLCFPPDWDELSMPLKVTLAKLVAPAVVLRLNKTVLFSELDVFWTHQLSPIGDMPPVDIAMSPHVDFQAPQLTCLCELNLGFYYVRATKASRALFVDMLNFVEEHFGQNWKHTDDQKLFDHAIRRNASRPADEQAPDWPERFMDLKLRNASNVSWVRLRGDLYTHNIGPKLVIINQTRAVHLSWGLDKARDRLDCAWHLGLIADPLYTPRKRTWWEKQVSRLFPEKKGPCHSGVVLQQGQLGR